MAAIGYEWQRVAAAVEAQIADGTLPPGAMLRGERAMAEEHGVAISTVRRALKDLRDRGLVVTLPAKGTFVAGSGLPGCIRMRPVPSRSRVMHPRSVQPWTTTSPRAACA
jgi:DNA-binding GntR family transcriptional regulator